MKKLLALGLSMVMAFTAIGCGDKTAEITFPANMYDGEITNELAEEIMEETGFESYVINEDGSITFTATESDIKEYKEEYVTEVETAFEELVNEDPAIEKIEHNEEFTEVEIAVDSAQLTPLHSLYAYSIMIMAVPYQYINGVADEDVQIVVNFVDKDTNEVIQTIDSSEL